MKGVHKFTENYSYYYMTVVRNRTLWQILWTCSVLTSSNSAARRLIRSQWAAWHVIWGGNGIWVLIAEIKHAYLVCNSPRVWGSAACLVEQARLAPGLCRGTTYLENHLRYLHALLSGTNQSEYSTFANKVYSSQKKHNPPHVPRMANILSRNSEPRSMCSMI